MANKLKHLHYKLFKFKHYHMHVYDKKDDKWLIEHLYESEFEKKIDLDNPKTFNEKIQWLKLNYNDPKYPMLVDKLAVRKYVEENIPELNLIPLLGTYNNPNEIDFDKLPNKFVLKCNHNSGRGVFVCRDKSSLSKSQIKKAKKELRKALKYNFYYETRERAYKNLVPTILCEQYMTDNPTVDVLTDYKFYCFNGYVDCVMVCTGRETGHPLFYFFDEQWKLKRINLNGLRAPEDFTIEKPSQMDAMFKLVSKLSKGMPYVRIDLYQINNKIYFGEFTFYPKGGLDVNYLPQTEKYFGDLIKLDLGEIKHE